MKRFMTTSIVLMLILSLCLGNFSGIAAMAATNLENGNTWYGDEVKVDVTAGTDAYNYMVLFRKYVHGYEFAGHFIGEGEAAQTFVMIDTAAHNGTTWTPSGEFQLGKSNYDVLYCCDVETMAVDGTYYKRVNLEDSEYYSEAQADMIRAIVTNAYPYVSLEEMKASLKAAGFKYADALTRNEIISAVQAAIWANANGMTAQDLRYDRSYKVSDNLQWGYPMHDTSAESGLEISGKRKFESYPEVGERHDALVDYLLALKPVKAQKNQIVISKLNIVQAQLSDSEGKYNVTMNVELNHTADEDDKIVLNAYVNGESVAEVKVNGEKNYTLNLNAAEQDEIKVVVSGTQNLEKGVYFYAPKPADTNGDGVATSREVSQNMVGVSMGATPVHAEATVSVENGVLVAKKTAEKIDDNRFEVSIRVPGGDGEVMKNHHELIMIIDGSYSGDDEWAQMKANIIEIGKKVLDGSGRTQVTVMAFGMGDNVVVEGVKTVAELETMLPELPGGLLYGRSSTNCEAGFAGALKYIESKKAQLSQVDVIFISDGGINTDETPRAFGTNWQTWATKFGALTTAQAAFEAALTSGKKQPAAFSVFGDRFAGKTNEQILNAVFVDKTVTITDAEYLAFGDKLWADVYAASGLTLATEYPISVVERAFVKYDKTNGTYIQDIFYYATHKSSYVTYTDTANRTIAAAEKLAANPLVGVLHLVRYAKDGRADWMSKITDSNYYEAESITNLLNGLDPMMEALAKTHYNNVVVTDYMSKWVILDPTTIRVVDANGNVVAVFDAENSPKDDNGNYTAYLYKWVGEALCAEKAPIVLDLIPESEYAAGGPDVIGNVDGPIYRITWNLKDGPLMRTDAYTLKYVVTANTEEPGFTYDEALPANGNTYTEYTDAFGNDIKVVIVVPDIIVEEVVTSVKVNKQWDDDDDFEGKRPDEITIRLYADGKEIAVQKVTKAGNWTGIFENLPVYANGQKIVYTITEDAVAGYETLSITGDAENGFTVTNQYQIEIEDNDPPLVDKTGDNIGGALVAVMLSMMGVVICVLLRKKENAAA